MMSRNSTWNYGSVGQMMAVRTREFRDALLLRGWSEKKAARFARAWGQRYLKNLQR